MDNTTPGSTAPRQAAQPWRVCLMFAITFSAALMFLIAKTAVNLPFSDEVLFGYLYIPISQDEFPVLRDLVAAHNGHPYLILKSLLAGVLHLDLPWTLLMYAQVPVLAAAFVLAARQMPAGAGKWSTVGVAGLAMVILTPHQWENLFWAMQFAFALSLLSSLSAFHFATRFANDPGNSKSLAAALASSLVASLANGAGIFAAGLTICAIFAAPGRRSLRETAWIAIASVVILAMYALSISLSNPQVPGDKPLMLMQAADHALRMLALNVGDFNQNKLPGLMAGLLLAPLVLWSMWHALRQWRSFTFELLCFAFGGILIAGVTYARLRVGIFQPEASRYVSLVMPVAIATILVLYRARRHVLLGLFVLAVAAGYLQATWITWRASPYQHAALQASLDKLCLTGEVTGPEVSPRDVKAIQQLFCEPTAQVPVATSAPAATSAPVAPPLRDLVIDDYGPRTTKAGQPFNQQADGKSGLWARANQSLDGYDAALYFDGHRLGDRGVSGRVVAGSIPAELLAKPGTYGVEIRIGADGQELASNRVDFVVE